MNTEKKQILFILSVATAIILIFSLNISLAGNVEDDYGYFINSNNTITLDDYYGDDSTIVVPSTIEGKVVTEIGDGVFSGNTTITNVTVPNGIKKIGNSAFNQCVNLTNISLPDSIIRIDSWAFNGCDGLEYVYIPSGVVGDSSFSGCDNLETIEIASGITTIESSAFSYCPKLKNVSLPNTITTLGDNSGFGVFVWDTSLQSISLPAGIKELTDSLFAYCTNLENVSISNSVKTIRGEAFYGCKKLSHIDLPYGIETIETDSFGNCDSLKEITIPGSVKTIQNRPFGGESKLERAVLNYGVECIGEYAFFWGTNLKSITIPSSVSSIGEHAFGLCSSLESISIPNSVTSIGLGAFSSCSSLKSFTFPNNIKSISSYCFSECTNLTGVTNLSSMNYIGEHAFYDCDSLTSVDVKNLSEISDGTFYECNNLKSIIFSNSLSQIGSEAFKNCKSLRNLEVPNSVTYIGSSAFMGCTTLTDIYFNSDAPSIANSAFRGDTLSIHYPAGNSTWISLASQGLEGNITWIPPLKDNRLIFSNDVWDFVNYEEGYHNLSSLDYSPMYNKLSASEKMAWREAKNESPTGGHCFGMAATVILNKMGKFNIADLNPSATSLRNASKNNKIDSFICFYQLSQYLRPFCSEKQSFLKLSKKQRIASLSNMVDAVSRGSSPVLIAFSVAGWGGHAIVGYEVKAESHKSSKSGITYDHIIYTYDCNNRDWNEDYCILFNSGTGVWEIPAYYEIGAISLNIGAQILCASNNSSIFGSPTSDISHFVDSYVGEIRFGNSCTYNVTNGSKSFKVNTTNGEIDDDTVTGYYDCNLDKNKGRLHVIIPNENSKCEIQPASGTSEEIKTSILYDDSFVAVDTSESKSVSFNPNGEISIEDNNGDFSITVAKDTVNKEEFSTYTVSGDSSGDVSLSVNKDGAIIEGDDLEGMTVIATDDNDNDYKYVIGENTDKIKLHADGNKIVKNDDQGGGGTTGGGSGGGTTDDQGWDTKYTVDKKASFTYDGSESIHKTNSTETKDTKVIPKVSEIKLYTKMTYTGLVLNPVIEISGLELDKDYTVTGISKSIGKHSAKIILIGDRYEGSKNITYNIVPKSTALSKLKSGKKSFTAKWKKQTIQTTGYQIRYSTNNGMKKSKTFTVFKNKTTTKKISKLKSKKKYYVQVRTFKTIKGKKYCSDWSTKKTIFTK